MSMLSPSLVQSSAALEDFLDQSFGEVIGTLVLGRHSDNLDVAILDLFPEMMPLNVVVFRSIGDLVFGSKGKSSIVIFVDCRSDLVLH